MKTRELQKDSIINEWFDTINPSDNTQKHYLSAMQKYTDFTGKTPEELIDEAEKEIDTGVRGRKRKIRRYLIDLRNQLQDSGLAEKTVQGYVSAVRSFYSAFEVDLPKLAKTENTVTTLEENTPIPTKSDLQVALKTCGVMEKALMLVGVSSGLSSNEIIRLKVKHFKEGYDPETKITTLPLRRAKVKFDFVTFFSPESSQAVQDYLDYRNRKSKDSRETRINQLEKQKVFSDSDFLFCKQNIPDTFLKTRNDKERQLTRGIFMKIYRTISEKACKNSPEGTWNLIRSHNMRRFFNSVLLNSGCDSFHCEFFMGHELNATQAAYFRASPEKLREVYQKYIPFLTIQKALDISESPEYQKIKNENQVLAAETVKHVVERSELQDLRTELEKAKVETASKAAEMEEMKKEMLTEKKTEPDRMEQMMRDMFAKFTRDNAGLPFESNIELSEQERTELEANMANLKRKSK